MQSTFPQSDFSSHNIFNDALKNLFSSICVHKILLTTLIAARPIHPQ